MTRRCAPGEMVVDMVHESWGAYRQLGIAAKFSMTPGAIRSHAPELGEHTHAILGGVGPVSWRHRGIGVQAQYKVQAKMAIRDRTFSVIPAFF